MIGRSVGADVGRTTILPGLAFINRNDRETDREYTDQSNFVNYPVKIAPELAPKPIDDTAFFGVGRSPRHGGGGAVTTGYHTLAIADWTSHLNPWFIMPKVPSAMVIGQPAGAHLPVAPRPNIERPGQTTYGALATLRPGTSVSPRYWALLGG